MCDLAASLRSDFEMGNTKVHRGNILFVHKFNFINAFTAVRSPISQALPICIPTYCSATTIACTEIAMIERHVVFLLRTHMERFFCHGWNQNICYVNRPALPLFTTISTLFSFSMGRAFWKCLGEPYRVRSFHKFVLWIWRVNTLNLLQIPWT